MQCEAEVLISHWVVYRRVVYARAILKDDYDWLWVYVHPSTLVRLYGPNIDELGSLIVTGRYSAIID